eukprot:COSAG05_NODE_11268_length_522_cov_0.723404_1_plen_35_part_01
MLLIGNNCLTHAEEQTQVRATHTAIHSTTATSEHS